jgi:clan AA aspartic protease (TIGR02281 family)
MKLAPALALVAATLLAVPAHATVYHWVDAQGTVHFTSEATRAAQQPGAVRREATEGVAVRPVAKLGSSAARIQVRYENDGHLIKVMVRLNNRVSVPCYVDTGSTGLVLPQSAIAQLGIDARASGTTAMLSTAVGRVEVPALKLESVRLGHAEVEGMWAMVAPSLEVGLLGGDFLNRFSYAVDPATQTITLTPRAELAKN